MAQQTACAAAIVPILATRRGYYDAALWAAPSVCSVRRPFVSKIGLAEATSSLIYSSPYSHDHQSWMRLYTQNIFVVLKGYTFPFFCSLPFLLPQLALYHTKIPLNSMWRLPKPFWITNQRPQPRPTRWAGPEGWNMLCRDKKNKYWVQIVDICLKERSGKRKIVTMIDNDNTTVLKARISGGLKMLIQFCSLMRFLIRVPIQMSTTQKLRIY